MFSEFSSQTSIRSLVHAKMAKSRWEMWMWYFLTAVTIVFTGWDVFDTVALFTSQPTGTKVQIQENRTIKFENTTICLPFHNRLEILAGLTEKSIPHFLEANNEFFATNDYDNAPEFWKLVQIQSLSLAVLSSISRLNYYVISKDSSYNYTLGYAKFSLNGSYIATEGQDEVKAAVQWFISKNISLETLMQIAGVMFCELANFEIKAWHHRTEKFKCSRSRVTWVGQKFMDPNLDFVCLQAIPGYFSFDATEDTTTIMMTYPSELNPNLYNLEDMISFDFSGQPVNPRRLRNILWVPIDSHVSVQIQILSQFKEISRKEKPCTSGSVARGTCQLLCRQEMIEKMCNCSPIPKILRNQVELSDCSFQLISDHKCELVRLKFPTDCSERCQRTCDYFSKTFSHMLYPSNLRGNRTYVDLFVDPYSFPVFFEFYLYTTKQFMASLGGNLSLYFGASFLALFHAFYFWTEKLLIRCLCIRRRTKMLSIAELSSNHLNFLLI